jgi:hypothetical protein
MADLLIGWQAYETEFLGDKVTMELLPLKNDTYRIVSPYMKKYESNEEITAACLEMQGKTLPIIERHVRNIKGVTVNGEPPTPEMLSQEVNLAMLTQDIVQELVVRSLLTKGEVKNLPEPSGQQTKAEDTQQA